MAAIRGGAAPVTARSLQHSWSKKLVQETATLLTLSPACAAAVVTVCLPVASLKGVTFRLSHLENALGASLLMEAAQGKNPYLIAALKSLPLTADDVSSNDAAAMAAGSTDTGSTDTGSSSSSSSGDTGGGRGIGAATAAEKQLAAALAQQLQEEMKNWPSSLAEDEQLLLSLVTRPPQLSPETAAALGKLAGDPRLLSAVKYRVERKRLLQACMVLLNVFTQD